MLFILWLLLLLLLFPLFRLSMDDRRIIFLAAAAAEDPIEPIAMAVTVAGDAAVAAVAVAIAA